MEERASSSSACSSSAAQHPATCWFPSSMKDKAMRLTVRNTWYTGQVIFLDELKSLLHFKMPKPVVGRHPRFLKGDLAMLQSMEGSRWWGEIISLKEDEDEDEDEDTKWPSLYTTLRIRVHPAGEALESLENVVVTMKPVAKSEPSQEVVKLGIKGFGKIERFLVEMGLQSIDVQVVAIQAPSMSPEIMIKVWKSPNINVSVKDSETLVFTRQYYEGHPKENRVAVLLEHMEVTIFREPNQIPWEQANADFVVECSTFFNKDKDAQLDEQSQVTNMTEDSNNCFRYLPKVLDAFGLYADGIMRTKFHDHETAIRAAKFNIVTSSSAAANAVCHEEIFPDWNKEPTRMSFLATSAPAALHRLADIDISNVDLQVTLVNAENCSGIESIHTRFCDADMEVHRRLKAIMSWCLDIICCVPIGACCLELA